MASLEMLIKNVEGALKDLKDGLASQGLLEGLDALEEKESVRNQREKTIEEINAELDIRL